MNNKTTSDISHEALYCAQIWCKMNEEWEKDNNLDNAILAGSNFTDWMKRSTPYETTRMNNAFDKAKMDFIKDKDQKKI